MQKLLLVYCYSENHTTSQIWKVPTNMVFPNFGGKKWRCSEHAHTSYLGAPIGGGKKGEFRDWTKTIPGGGTLRMSGWGCAAETLEPLAYTRASSAEFCYPILE